MKGKSLIFAAVLLTGAAMLFTACNNHNQGTGQYVFVTDKNGVTVVDKNGNPVTEEWKTSVVYATDENGETYTNANGEKVTVKQTLPVLTSVIKKTKFAFDDEGKVITNKDGSYATEVRTVTYTKNVTNKDGSNVTQKVTDKNGSNVTETVTDKKGETQTQIVTEFVTETVTEDVTEIVEIKPNDPITQYQTYPKNTTEKTTPVYENPQYSRTEVTTERPNKITLPSTLKIAARQDWLKGFGASSDDRYSKVLATGSNSFIALGQTTTEGKGFYSLLTKFDADGNVIWDCAIDVNNFPRMHDFAILSDGSIITVGEDLIPYTFEEANEKGEMITYEKEYYRAVMAKVSSDGNILWYKTFGNTAAEYFTSVTALPDGGYAAGGKFVTDVKSVKEVKRVDEKSGTVIYTDEFLEAMKSFLNFKTDALTVKFNSDGEEQWSSSFGGSGNDWVNAIAADAAGNIYSACHTNSKDGDAAASNGSTDVFVVKYGIEDGTQQWSSILKGSKTEEVEDIYADDTGCVFVGRYASADGVFALNRGSYDAYMAHCTADGSIDWVRTYGGLKGERFYSVTPTSFGYAVTGVSYSDNRDFKDIGNLGGYDSFIMSIDNAGNIENVKSLSGTGNDGCYDICRLSGDVFIVVGETYKTDNHFAGISPAASSKNSTAFVGKYRIY